MPPPSAKEETGMYTAFASVYDKLMSDVDYPAWAAFYRMLLWQRGLPQGKVCECACGTGTLTILLSSMGYQLTGVDVSADMLFEASQKARKSGAMIPFVKQDMRQLRLHRQMDAVLCTNDGINYLPTKQAVYQFFCSSFEVLRPGGALLFDLSTPYKLENILGNRFWGDETESIAYLWQNTLAADRQSVQMDLAIFSRQTDGRYLRIEEHQRQHIYPLDVLQRLLWDSGFEDLHIFGDKRLQEPVPQEERWFISARKPMPQETEQPY